MRFLRRSRCRSGALDFVKLVASRRGHFAHGLDYSHRWELDVIDIFVVLERKERGHALLARIALA